MTLVSANIRFVPIFEGFIGERASNDSGVIENMDYHGFHICCWNSPIMISQLISIGFLLSADLNVTDLLQREHPEILAGIEVGLTTRGILLLLIYNINKKPS